MNTRKCKRTPYLIQARRAAKSPYGSTRRVRAVYAKYKAGQSVGFTARSSLKSMGLVPRADGCYVLGNKYI
jgi:hypothetical protein